MAQPAERSVLAVVPARGGSKGIPRKNLRLLGGLPLIAHSLRAAQASRLVTRLVVSTDDPEIAQTARAYGASAPFVRPAELASDSAAQIDVVLHALHTIEESEGIEFQAILLLQPTAPLRTSEDIDAAISRLWDTGADSIISLYPVEHGHPYYMYTLEGDRPAPLLSIPPEITRRQQFPQVYVRNGAIYLARREVLLTRRSFYGRDLRAYVMPFERSINIDHEFDLALAEFLWQRQTRKA